MITAYSAKTTFPNTLESDQMPTVYHTVGYNSSEGVSKAYVRAKDPCHAIDIVNRMTEEEIKSFTIKPTTN